MKEHQVVRYDNVEIEVFAEGEGDLVVLLPSLGRDSDDYDQAVTEFVRHGYRVLRPRPRGIGLSSGASRGVTLHDYALDIAQVIDSEQRGPAIVVGHAYGNWVARSLATDYPHLVRGIVIAAAGAKYYPAYLTAYIDKCEDTALPEAERLKYLRMTFFAPGSDPRPWLQGWHREVKHAQRAARAATPLNEFWGAGTALILDLIGAEDPFRPADTRQENRQELGPRVTVAVIPKASHALLPEQPALVADAVCRWAVALPAPAHSTA